MHFLKFCKYNGFEFLPGFDERFSLQKKHLGVRQIIPKLILHKILDVLPHIHFMDKGLSIVQKIHVRCDAYLVIWLSINRF